jgi:hypothetical protein
LGLDVLPRSGGGCGEGGAAACAPSSSRLSNGEAGARSDGGSGRGAGGADGFKTWALASDATDDTGQTSGYPLFRLQSSGQLRLCRYCMANQ